MQLHDLIDKDLLGDMYDRGYISLQVHPRETLGILNYTKKAAWEAEWNDATRKCRGLIYDMTTMRIVARPFDKFFNYEQLQDWTPPSGPVVVTDKQDGSLGIMYHEFGGNLAIATRGSFASDQALHATQILRQRYSGLVRQSEMTYLFEIIYPENRIVLDYGPMDDLILLGAVNIETGQQYTPVEAKYMLHWPGMTTEIFNAWTWEDALALEPRENAEGIVVHFTETGERVKLKQEDYVALHRIVTGMTDRTVWEAIGQGKTMYDIMEPLPEEFHPWVEKVVNDLIMAASAIVVRVYEEFFKITMSLGPDFSRKDFALAVKDHPDRAYLFKYLDGQPVWDIVWKQIKPAATRSLVVEEEE